MMEASGISVNPSIHSPSTPAYCCTRVCLEPISAVIEREQCHIERQTIINTHPQRMWLSNSPHMHVLGTAGGRPPLPGQNIKTLHRRPQTQEVWGGSANHCTPASSINVNMKVLSHTELYFVLNQLFFNWDKPWRKCHKLPLKAPEDS